MKSAGRLVHPTMNGAIAFEVKSTHGSVRPAHRGSIYGAEAVKSDYPTTL